MKKCQDPETRNDKKRFQESEDHPHGKQDPLRTQEKEENGAKNDQDPEGTSGFSAAPFVGCRIPPGLRAFRLNQDGTGRVPAMATSSGDATGSELRSTAARRGAAVFGGDGAGSSGYGHPEEAIPEVGPQVEQSREEVRRPRDPWILAQFLHPPGRGSSDTWELGLTQEGWLVRLHRKSRKRLYHPLHQNLPIDPTQLSTERNHSESLYYNGGSGCDTG